MTYRQNGKRQGFQDKPEVDSQADDCCWWSSFPLNSHTLQGTADACRLVMRFMLSQVNRFYFIKSFVLQFVWKDLRIAAFSQQPLPQIDFDVW